MVTRGEAKGAAGPGAMHETLGRAESLASRHGLPTFSAWRTGLERRYTVMPPWYWNERHCRENYITHIRTAIDWQRRESRINRGNSGFHRSLIP